MEDIEIARSVEKKDIRRIGKEIGLRRLKQEKKRVS